MVTKLHRHINIDGSEAEPTYDEVSDEELQAEADEVRLKEICAMGHSMIPLPILVEGFKLLCKRLGYLIE